MDVSLMRVRAIVCAATVFSLVVAPFAVGAASDSGGPGATASASVKKKVKKLSKRVNGLEQANASLEQQVAELEGEVGTPRPPSGPAGGDLAGIYPNPLIGGGVLTTGAFSNSIPAARVTNSTQQTVPPNTSLPLAFDTEIYDTASMHSTNPFDSAALRAPVDGIYAVTAQVKWGAAGGVTTFFTLQLLRNGSQNLWEEVEDSPTSPLEQSAATQVDLQAGDFVQAVVRQNSVGNFSIDTDSELSPEFSMTWLAPGP